METFKKMLSQIKQQSATKLSDIEELIEDECEHLMKEEICGSVFCVSCDEEFEDLVDYQWYLETTDSDSDDQDTDHHQDTDKDVGLSTPQK